MDKENSYRPNVAMVIMSSNYPEKKEIFVAQRNDLDNVWQFPQGGIDEGEEVKEALFRELEEEVGTNKASVVAEYPQWLSYDFPEHVAEKMAPYKGQNQKYFLLKLDDNAMINLQTKHPEFNAYKFVEVKDVLGVITEMKKPVYEKVINYFKDEGLL